MPKNFILSRDIIKQAIKQFTTRKTIKVIHDALGPNPQWGEDALSLAIVGLPSEVSAVTRTTGEVDAREITKGGDIHDNPHSPTGTPAIHMLPFDSSSEEVEDVSADLVKILGLLHKGLTTPLLKRREENCSRKANCAGLKMKGSPWVIIGEVLLM